MFCIQSIILHTSQMFTCAILFFPPLNYASHERVNPKEEAGHVHFALN